MKRANNRQFRFVRRYIFLDRLLRSRNVSNFGPYGNWAKHLIIKIPASSILDIFAIPILKRWWAFNFQLQVCNIRTDLSSKTATLSLVRVPTSWRRKVVLKTILQNNNNNNSISWKKCKIIHLRHHLLGRSPWQFSGPSHLYLRRIIVEYLKPNDKGLQFIIFAPKTKVMNIIRFVTAHRKQTFYCH